MIDMLTSGTIAIPVWCFPSKKPLLDRGEVHLWQAQLDALATYLERFEDSLCSDERQRAEEFRFQRDRRCFIVARALLRSPDTHRSRAVPTVGGVERYRDR